MQRNTINFSLSQQDTLMIKGVAICAMLWHHLFGCGIPADAIVHADKMTLFLGAVGKVCVAMFLFASGYGLSIQFGKVQFDKYLVGGKLLQILCFWLKRFTKFYLNYWVIFLIFVPIGVWVFGRGLQVPYGENANVLKCLILDIVGLQGASSYNITWWFNKLIIYLWIGFPLIYVLIKKYPILTLLVLLIWMRFNKFFPYLNIYSVQNFALPFAIGIAWAINREWLNTHTHTQLWLFGKWQLLIITSVLIVLCMLQRQYPIVSFGGTRIDSFLTIFIVLFLMQIRNLKYVATILQFLGKHSMNIYMIHTFIFAYWFKQFIYATHYPIAIFLVLLCVCLSISIGLEWIKNKCGVYKLMEIITCTLSRYTVKY